MRIRALSVLAALVLAAPALADPPPGTIMKVTPPGEKMSPDRACQMRIEIEIAQLGHLKAALALDAGQLPLFEAWRKVHLDVTRGWPCPLPPTGLGVPAPQRIENQIANAAMTLDALRKEQPATEALYKVLKPAQRAVFDGPKQGVPPPGAPPKPGAPPLPEQH